MTTLMAVAAAGGSSHSKGTLWQLDVAVVALVAALAVAFLIFAVVVLRAGDDVEAGPRTLETPPQTPAVAALLTHPQEVPGEAAAATLVDLVARGALDVIELGGGTPGIRVTNEKLTDLTPYEERVLALVGSHVDASGIAPAAELAISGDSQAASWLKDFRNEVRVEAKKSGWVRRRYGREVLWLTVVLVGLGLVVLIWGQSTATHFRHGKPLSDLPDGYLRQGLTLAAAAVAFLDFAMLVSLGNSTSLRLTAGGRELASRWRGVAEHLHDNEQLDEAPVGAVAIWHRLLAYATAFGVARSVQVALPLGPMSPTRAWSPQTGSWRQVEIDYPKHWPPGWGRRPWELIKLGLGTLFRIGVPVIVIGVVLSRLISDGVLHDADIPPLAYVIAGLVIAAFGGMLLLGVWQLVVATYLIVGGVSGDATVEGTVVRVLPSENNLWTWVAVDDGSTNKLRAFASRMGCPVRQGGKVRLAARRVGGQVLSIDGVAEPSRERSRTSMSP